jgi:hypothetical protein
MIFHVIMKNQEMKKPFKPRGAWVLQKCTAAGAAENPSKRL